MGAKQSSPKIPEKLIQDFSQYKKVEIQSKSLCVSSKLIVPVEETTSYYNNDKPFFVKSNIPSNCHKLPDNIPFGLIGALMAAYNNHADVVISPDDFWITVLHGFSLHINSNAEKLRSYFVDHEGKKELAIFIGPNPQETNKWDEVIQLFQDALNSAVKSDVAKLQADFSTSGNIEKIVSSVATISAFKKYFDYACYTCCGIRNIYFAGTLEDWQSLRAKVERLSKYECEAWISRLLPVLDKFIEAYKNETKPDKEFWNKMAHILGAQKGSGRNCPGLTGWITAFIPYEADGYKSSGVVALPNIPEPIFETPFLLKLLDSGKEFKYKFSGGFTGMLYENEAFKPQLSYAVLMHNPN